MDDGPAILGGVTTHRDHYHHGNLREALVDAAQCLITDTGITGLSMRKVAKHAGVSQAAPYHHFPNKEALLAEVSRRGFLELVAQMRDRGDVEGPVASLRHMGHAYIRFAVEHAATYRLMFGPEFCPTDEHTELREAASAAFLELVMAVQAGQQQGVFTGEEPAGPSMAVWSAMHGLVSLLQTRVHEGKEMGGVVLTTEAMITATLDLVLTGLGA